MTFEEALKTGRDVSRPIFQVDLRAAMRIYDDDDLWFSYDMMVKNGLGYYGITVNDVISDDWIVKGGT